MEPKDRVASSEVFTRPADGSPSSWKAKSLNDKTDVLEKRLKTFQCILVSACIQFASAGFSYDERRKKIMCEYCELTIDQDCSDPLVFHKQKSPHCSFFGKTLETDSRSSLPTKGAFTNPPKPPAPPTAIRNAITGPGKYPEYRDHSARVATFQGWPLQAVKQFPDHLAKCGFFYIGSADRVRCFYCGITLRNWEAEDDPYLEHKNWAPRCTFIQTLPPPDRRPASLLPPAITAASQAAEAPPTEGQDGGSRGSPPNQTSHPHCQNSSQSHQQTRSVSLPSVGNPSPGSLPATPGGERSPEAILDSPAVQAVISMGMPRHLVERVWREKCVGGQPPCAMDLYLAVESCIESH